ncbi:MAG TPA: Fic family protein [Chthonomonadaceae bacterium]|nr:Fic family protein [Chthonomonadaceae bacterium]
MEYLTTHDIVWINTSITGKVNPYNYVTLEAAMAGQYSYGDSHNVPGQAANLLDRLLCTRPFSEGNVRTAFIAALSFLDANGYATRVDDAEAAQLITEVESGETTAHEAVLILSAPAASPIATTVTLRRLITHEINHHLEALKLLAASD